MSHIEKRCAACGSDRMKKVWNLELDEYQRDNLLWLLNLVGYPQPDASAVEPFTFANTGDWVGEIVIMLRDTDGNMIAEGANEDPETIRKRIKQWRGPVA